MTTSDSDRWSSGSAYEAFIGRWSRLVAPKFLERLGIPPGQRWLDVGCGTGILTGAILERCEPRSVVGVDPSEPFVACAREQITDDRASFQVGTAAETGSDDDAFDVAVAGLVLNFVPDVDEALAEMRRVVRPGGTVAAYVWDYGDGMQLLRRFWGAAIALDPAAKELDEAPRFPITAPSGLATAFEKAGLKAVDDWAIEIPTVFSDFDDLWTPFLGGTGPGPSYVASQSDSARDALRDRLRSSVEERPDGSIHLTARAWAAQGSVPTS